ncbi:MAG: hypothetical protein WA978_12130 [Sphingopyxis granuli]|uniref:hypothetical protein n=1 Tax=Sphingopyxis granuli TaxID=267128 RepID=UPI003C787164
MTERLRYATNRPVGYDGMHDSEREIMRLFDAGAGIDRIIEITGLTFGQVQNVTGMFSVTALEEWKIDARAGSAALLTALRQHHPNRCGAAS